MDALVWMLVAGCQDAPGVPPAPERSPEVDTAVPVVPLLSIEEPLDGSGFYATDGLVRWTATDWEFDEAAIGGAAVEGRGHAHVYLDEAFVTDVAADRWLLAGLEVGFHTVRVALAENDHDEFGVEDERVVAVALPSLTIDAPADGAVLTVQNTPIAVRVSGFELVASNDVAFGEGHWTLHVDGALAATGHDPSTVWASGLAPGPHTLGVELVHGDGLPLDPPVHDEVRLVVADGAPGIRVDRERYPPGSAWDSATVPLSIMADDARDPLAYHVYVDGRYVSTESTAELVLWNMPPGPHVVEVRLLEVAGGDTGARDVIALNVTPDRPDVRVTHPIDGRTVGRNLMMTFEVENFTMRPPGHPNAPDEGHVVVRLDGEVVGVGTDGLVTLADLPGGLRVLRVELARSDGSPLDPPVWAEVAVRVD